MQITKDVILSELKSIKTIYKNDGINILGIFGSYANGNYSPFSDIDIAYSINKKVFFDKFKGFVAVSRLSDIKDEISAIFNKKVDFISIESSNKILNENIKKSIVYV